MTGHFTAMIWKTVTTVGFGYAVTKSNGGYKIYVVANYYPLPNWRGHEKENVPPPL